MYLEIHIQIPTQMLGINQTSNVHSNMREGNATRVAVNPNFWMAAPVPNKEKRKEMELVV
jgi:hypothetical protein